MSRQHAERSMAAPLPTKIKKKPSLCIFHVTSFLYKSQKHRSDKYTDAPRRYPEKGTPPPRFPHTQSGRLRFSAAAAALCKNNRHVLYILSQLFSSRLFHVAADWLYVPVLDAVSMDAAGINSAEERHVSTN